MRRGRGKENGRKEKEDKLVEKEGRIPDCNNTGHVLGTAGKTLNMSQATLSQYFTLMHVFSL